MGIEGHIPSALDALAAAVPQTYGIPAQGFDPRRLRENEIEKHKRKHSFSVKPQRIMADIRAAMEPEDIVLADTGAVKMWMTRLYPTYKSDTCLVSNGLASMAFAIAGALAAKLAFPQRKVLAAVGDGAFIMSSQEIETAMREKIPFVILIWEDGAYGLIKWKMELELGRSSHMSFTNPDFVKSLARRVVVSRTPINSCRHCRKRWLPIRVSVITCLVDYSENKKLTTELANLVVRA